MLLAPLARHCLRSSAASREAASANPQPIKHPHRLRLDRMRDDDRSPRDANQRTAAFVGSRRRIRSFGLIGFYDFVTNLLDEALNDCVHMSRVWERPPGLFTISKEMVTVIRRKLFNQRFEVQVAPRR